MRQAGTPSNGRLVVAWSVPDTVAARDVVLSFLPAADEDHFRRTVRNSVISGRALALEVRSEAIDGYDVICRRVAVSTDRTGSTLRSALRHGNRCSDWWFHPISSRQGWPGVPILEWLVAVLAIDRCATSRRATVLVLHGAARPVVDVLRKKYTVHAFGTVREMRPVVAWYYALRGRWNLLRSTVRVARTAPQLASGERRGRLVALTSAWNLWLRWDDRQNALVDTHFKSLGRFLSDNGLTVVRYVWLPESQLAASSSWRRPFVHGDCVVLQRFLPLRRIVKEVLSFRAALVYWRWKYQPSFRAAWQLHGLDVYPLYRFALGYSFINSQMPLGRLFALATESACNTLRPSAVISHWEHGAHYEGVRRARPGPISCVMQHSPNVARAIYRVDLRTDFKGEPDGCAVPHADHVFAMGEAAVERFLSGGYNVGQLSRTGSIRFDHVQSLRQAVNENTLRRFSGPVRPLRVLVAPTENFDIELVEAVCVAVEGLEEVIHVHVRLRPGDTAFGRDPRFERVASRIRQTTGSLAEDLSSADLVLFTHSSIGDQAFVCGIPTWQWITMSYEGWPLGEVVHVPQFYSVDSLRDGLRRFAKDPQSFQPSASDIVLALRTVFGAADGLEAQRIADEVTRLLEHGSKPKRAPAEVISSAGQRC